MRFYRALSLSFLLLSAFYSTFSTSSESHSPKGLEDFAGDYLHGKTNPFFISDYLSTNGNIKSFEQESNLALNKLDYAQMEERIDILKKNRTSSVFSALLSGQNYCFISIKNETIAYHFSNKEVELNNEFSLVHELEHCLDWSRKLNGEVADPAQQIENEDVYREMYADVAASIYIASQQGDLSIFDDVMLFRTMAFKYNHDVKHWSYLALKEAKQRMKKNELVEKFKGDYRLMATESVAQSSRKYPLSIYQCISKQSRLATNSNQYAVFKRCSPSLGDEISTLFIEMDKNYNAAKLIAFYKEVK